MENVNELYTLKIESLNVVALSQLKGRQRPNVAPATEAPAVKDAGAYSAPAPAATPQVPESAKLAPAPQFKCKFHPGEVSYKVHYTAASLL